MDNPKFDNIQDLKEWAEKLEFINQLPKEEYEKFRAIYSRIMFFESFFDHLIRMERILKQVNSTYTNLKDMIDSGDLARAVELQKKVEAIVGDDW